MPAERLDPVREATQPRAVRGVRAADAVVGHDDPDQLVATGDPYVRLVHTGVLGDVGQRLGDEVVGRRLKPAARRGAKGAALRG